MPRFFFGLDAEKDNRGGRGIVRTRTRTRPMTANLRHTLLSVRDLLVTGGPFIVLAIALLALAYWLLDPTPPKRVVLATGPDQGAYAEFGKRYVKALKEYGIEVELRSTQGAAENLQLLEDPDFGRRHRVRAGRCRRRRAAADEADDDRLVSLGSLFYEPVWLFYRADSAQRLLDAPTLDEPVAAAALAPQHRRSRQRRAEPGARLIEANRIDRRRTDAAAPGADAGGGGAARRRDRCPGVRLGARVADGADAAADAGHPALRLRPGRRLCAPLRRS